MRKLASFVFILLLYVESLFAQFDPQYSQYMLNHTAFNPAAAAESGMIDVIGQYRLQWLGMPNGGKTLNLSISSPLKINNSEHAIGLKFLDDKVGAFINQSVHLTYAYKTKVFDGKLSIGADLGFLSVGFNGDSVLAHLVPIGSYFELTSDPAIPTSAISGISFNSNLGVWFSNENLYSGISLTHINQPVIDWGTTTEFKPSSTLFVAAGYNYHFPDKKYILTPSFLYKSDFTTVQMELSGKIEYDKKYWGGLSYRYQDAVILFGGINITGGLTIGYSYDLPINRILSTSSGSHEICMIYSFEYVPIKVATKYKSIRIL